MRSMAIMLNFARLLPAVIAELLQQPLPNGYLDYLRHKLRDAAPAPSAGVPKNTLSRDR
jgi:hypothetical protein